MSLYFVIPLKTCTQSDIWGTHVGLTKLVASITGNLVALSKLINWIFVSAGTNDFSFCRPSRGPTSTILTYFGQFLPQLLVLWLPVLVEYGGALDTTWGETRWSGWKRRDKQIGCRYGISNRSSAAAAVAAVVVVSEWLSFHWQWTQTSLAIQFSVQRATCKCKISRQVA